MLVFHLPLSLPAVAGSQARFARSQRPHALMVDCKGTRKGLPFSPGRFRTSSQPPAMPPFARASLKTIPTTHFFPRHHPSTLDRGITLHRFFDFSPPLRLLAQQNATGCNLPAILPLRRFVAASLRGCTGKRSQPNPPHASKILSGRSKTPISASLPHIHFDETKPNSPPTIVLDTPFPLSYLAGLVWRRLNRCRPRAITCIEFGIERSLVSWH